MPVTSKVGFEAGNGHDVADAGLDGLVAAGALVLLESLERLDATHLDGVVVPHSVVKDHRGPTSPGRS